MSNTRLFTGVVLAKSQDPLPQVVVVARPGNP